MCRFLCSGTYGLVFSVCACLGAGGAAPPGENYGISKIRFFPREGHAAKMKGGRFVGSLTSATNDFENIVQIQQAPSEGEWTELVVPRDRVRAFRFVKYHARNDLWADMAELEFYVGDRKLAGTPFGTTGSGKLENDPKLAFGGNPKVVQNRTTGLRLK